MTSGEKRIGVQAQPGVVLYACGRLLAGAFVPGAGVLAQPVERRA